MDLLQSHNTEGDNYLLSWLINFIYYLPYEFR